MAETPTLMAYRARSATYDPGDWKNAVAGIGHLDDLVKLDALRNLQNQFPTPIKSEVTMAATPRRVVKVYIVDPDENVPVSKCLLFEGEAKLTDLTDQELFFEIEIKSILDKHNAYRVTLTDKKVKERDQKLEPARIRDLKMTVVTLAAFA